MTKLIIPMIMLLFCLSLNAQSSTFYEPPSTPTFTNNNELHSGLFDAKTSDLLRSINADILRAKSVDKLRNYEGAKDVIALPEKVDCIRFFGQLVDAEGKNIDKENVRIFVAEIDGNDGVDFFTNQNGAFEVCLKCDSDFSVKVFPLGHYMKDVVVSTKNIECSMEEKIEMKFEIIEILEEETMAQGTNMNSLDTLPAKEDIAQRNKENKSMLEGISITEEVEDVTPIEIVTVENKAFSTAEELIKEEITIPAIAKESSTTETAVTEMNTADAVALPKVYYDFDRYQIEAPSKAALKDLAGFLKEHPNKKLSIKSYTDAQGKKAYNKWLSKRRAEQVMQYFLEIGINENQLEAEGKGERLDENKPEFGDFAKQRVTEFEIVSIENSTESFPDSKPATYNVSSSDNLYVSNVHYAFDSFVLNDDSKSEVENVILRLLDDPELKVEIQSHTDSRGNNKYNQSLSEKRSMEVLQYMVAKGIASERLSAVGFGESVLVNDCEDGVRCSKEAHLKNRRTEFVFR